MVLVTIWPDVTIWEFAWPENAANRQVNRQQAENLCFDVIIRCHFLQISRGIVTAYRHTLRRVSEWGISGASESHRVVGGTASCRSLRAV